LILLLGAFTGSAAYKFSSTRAGLYKEARAETIRLPNGTNFMVLSAEDTKSLLEHVQTFQAAPEPGNKPTSTKSIPDTGINSTTPAVTADQLLEGLILQSAPPGLTVTIGIVIIGFALFWLIVFPSSWYEFLPMRASANMSARLLGNWVSAGFRHLKLGINIIWAAVFLVPLLSLIVGIGYYAHAKPRGTFLLFFYTTSLMDIDGKLLIWVGGIILTAALGGTLLKFLARIFEVDTSAVLGTILDVDNYLRTSPASSTPRAHIVERYTALLRHIHAAREEDGSRSYDHIVIVAHSLGSLITADLFRFLHSNRDHHLVEFTFGGLHSERLPIYLFSMGCPVRQLLSRFFPHLYQWIREIPEDTGFPIPASEPGKPIPAGESPSPSDLGVKQWVNFYRSGDYVGRSVWINGVTSRTSGGLDDGEYPVPPEPTIYCDTSDPSRATRIDACIGPGAHTHYWDGTAPDVGVQLDKLIAL